MTDSPDIREQVAAFLAGDLDDVAAEELQARIDTEPWVAQLADEMADMLVALGRVDDVPLPEGFTQRMFAGMESELGRSLAPPLPDRRALHASGAAAATGWAEDARPRGRHDPDRPSTREAGREGTGRRRRLRGALAVAAVVAVIAVAGVGVLTQAGTFGGGDDTADMAFSDADDSEALRLEEEVQLEAASGDEVAAEDDTAADSAEATDSAAAAADTAEQEALDEEDDAAGQGLAADARVAAEATEDDAATMQAPTTSPDGPAVLSLGQVADDDDAVAAAVGDQPAVQALMGAQAVDVAELAAAYRDELLRGPDFADGTAAGACLTDTLDAAGQDLVPAVAAQLELPGGPAVAYALVRSRDGATLDAVDVWVLDLPGCGLNRVIRQG